MCPNGTERSLSKGCFLSPTSLIHLHYMDPYIFTALGAVGLLCITIGVLIGSTQKRNLLFVVGGIGLLFYSLSLKDPVFIPLQTIFILASLYEIYTVKKS